MLVAALLRSPWCSTFDRPYGTALRAALDRLTVRWGFGQYLRTDRRQNGDNNMHSQFDTVDNDNKAHNNSPDHRVTVTLSRGAKRDIPAICFSCGAETMYRGNAKAWADYQAGYRNSESVFRNLADRDKHWLLSGLCYDCQPA